MKPLLALACLVMLTACGSGGAPPPRPANHAAGLHQHF